MEGVGHEVCQKDSVERQLYIFLFSLQATPEKCRYLQSVPVALRTGAMGFNPRAIREALVSNAVTVATRVARIVKNRVNFISTARGSKDESRPK